MATLQSKAAARRRAAALKDHVLPGQLGLFDGLPGAGEGQAPRPANGHATHTKEADNGAIR